MNTNVSQKLMESAGRTSNPPEFVRGNEWSRKVEVIRGEVRKEV